MHTKLLLTLACGLLLTACGSPAGGNSANTASAQVASAANSSQTVAVPPVSSAHGGATQSKPAPGAASTDKPDLPTPELDIKIAKAEAKAQAPGATDADKKAVSAAYGERANVYRDAGRPALYKFALGDYRRALRYDPNNADARSKMDEIVAIYQQMGRPVPTNGLDQ
jgi:hypothetical protein